MKRLLVYGVVLALIGSGCGETRHEVVAPQVRTSPAFVNRLVAGHRPLALVAVDDDGGAALTATIDLADAAVSVEPRALTGPGVAEIWVDLPAVDLETPFVVTVVADRDAHDRSVTIDATAVPGTDDLAATATEIAAVFVRDLNGEAGLPTSTTGLVDGTPVAGLLVVSHYAWFTDDLEIGLSWHIMIAPDDFSELYVRRRDELVPERAWRIDSWSRALAGSSYTLSEIEPPAEVVR
jgi:hypothetical protein